MKNLTQVSILYTMLLFWHIVLWTVVCELLNICVCSLCHLFGTFFLKTFLRVTLLRNYHIIVAHTFIPPNYPTILSASHKHTGPLNIQSVRLRQAVLLCYWDPLQLPVIPEATRVLFLTLLGNFTTCGTLNCRSQWPIGVRHGMSPPARTLG
jgi:hypothetical protein